MMTISRHIVLILSGLFVSSAVVAANNNDPQGFWLLENRDIEVPLAGLNLNNRHRFELLVYDDKYQLYAIEGLIKKKSDTTWELKDGADHSNTFLMTRDGNKIRLIDSENQKIVFLESTCNQLEKELKQLSPNKKVNK